MNNQTQLCNMEILIGKCKQLQAQLTEKESTIEQMVDVSIVTKLNEEITKKNKKIGEAVHIIQSLLGYGGIDLARNIEPIARQFLEKAKDIIK